MAKLKLNGSSRNKMASEFANKVVGSPYSQSICLYRKDITDSVDFNNMEEIDLTNQYSDEYLTINGLQNFKKLSLVNNSGKVELSSIHNVSSNDDIGNYENLGSLVWAIPGYRNADWVVIGSHYADAGYFRAHAAIQLSPSIPPSSDVKTFLISNLSIEFKGDGE